MIILFDFDHTLFNTEVFKNKVLDKVSNYTKTPKNDIKAIHGKYFQSITLNNSFSAVDFCKFIAKELYLDANEIYNYVYEKNDIYEKSLYPDTIPVLKELSTHSLGIFSQGVVSFQKQKFFKCGISQYFDPKLLYFYQDKLLNRVIKLLPQVAYVVDNKREVINTIKKNKSLKPVYINRLSEKFHYAPQIQTLRELKSLIK